MSMRTLETWEKFIKMLDNLPEYSETYKENKLGVEGYFEPYVLPSEELPSNVFAVSRTIRDIMEESFNSLEVQGIETPHGRCPTNEDIRYEALIYGVHDNEIVTQILMYMTHPYEKNRNKRERASFAFDVALPLGDYESRSKEALKKMWHLVRGIEWKWPKDPEIASKPEYQNGAIILLDGGKIIASGYPAFERIGINLEKKCQFMYGTTH